MARTRAGPAPPGERDGHGARRPAVFRHGIAALPPLDSSDERACARPPRPGARRHRSRARLGGRRPGAGLGGGGRGWGGRGAGGGPRGGGPPGGGPPPGGAAMALPLWGPGRVRAAAARRSPDLLGPRADVAAIALSPHGQGGGRATWLVAPMPSLEALTRAQPPPGWTDVHRGGWARAGRPLAAVEADSGLVFAQLMTHDSAAWFGPGFREFAVAAPDSWPALRASGIALGRWWRRAALAWALQSPELARAETDGLLLLWRRDVVERLQRLAPLPRLYAPDPLLAAGRRWVG